MWLGTAARGSAIKVKAQHLRGRESAEAAHTESNRQNFRRMHSNNKFGLAAVWHPIMAPV